jgi:D-tyrosyl-tRNA(Tyr) deacylase
MRTVVQRSGPARCEVDGVTTGWIDGGLVVLISVDPEDTPQDIEWMGNKIAGLRIFNDPDNKMNLSILDVIADQKEDKKIGILSISQFTLHGNARKGFRPSFVGAAPPDKAADYYKLFNEDLQNRGLIVEEGIFGAMMDIHLVNEGPVTILIDSKHKF